MLNTSEFINDSLVDIISNVQMDVTNNSDHYPVSVEFIFKEKIERANKILELQKITNEDNKLLIKIYPDLENVEIKDKFLKKVEILLREKMIINRSEDCKININNIYVNINMAIKESYESLVIIKNKFFKTNVWWTKELKDIKSEMLSIKKRFKISRSFNSNTEEYIRLKELRKLFRSQQRVNLRNKDLKNYKFVEELASDKGINSKKFWHQVKKFNNNSKLKKINISINLLEQHFKKIFNEEDLDLNEFQKNIVNDVKMYENSILLEDEDIREFSDIEIDFAIKESKNSKAVGEDSICSLWLKKSNSTTIRYYLMKLFNSIYKYGIFPLDFNLCKIRPIIKNFSKSNDDVCNVRPISISGSIAQLFERLVLNRNYKNFKTSKNQFGFKKKSSCKLALFCIKEAIIEYIEKHSECYLVALDAEKAFDKLWRDGMFFKLMQVLERREWLILKQYYKISEAKVMNNSEYSSKFKILTGVKQGGILSPFLFNMYIDGLVEEILNLNIGAKLGTINMNIMSYCDDISLIFSCPIHGQLMLDKCQMFTEKWKLKFNPHKSNVTVFGNPIFRKYSYKLNNVNIEYKDKLKILGYEFFSKTLNENELLIENFSKVRKSFFGLNRFGMKPNGLNPFLQAFLFNSFCLSKLTYAIEIMSVSDKTLNNLNVMQNNLTRYLLELNKHCYLSSIQQALIVRDI